MEILDSVDGVQRYLLAGSLLLVSRDWYVDESPHCVCSEYLLTITANRTLEDLDDYYRSDPPLIVTQDPDAICRKRPLKYIQREEDALERTTASKGLPSEQHIEWTEHKRGT